MIRPERELDCRSSAQSSKLSAFVTRNGYNIKSTTVRVPIKHPIFKDMNLLINKEDRNISSYASQSVVCSCKLMLNSRVQKIY